MSDPKTEIEALDKECQRLDSIFEDLVGEGLIDDSRRCEIRDTIVDEFTGAATIAAEAGGYEFEGEPDIYQVYPEEIYPLLESIEEKKRFVHLYRNLLRS
jgi:hypothetical protein